MCHLNDDFTAASERVRRFFCALDEDRDGTLSREEFSKGVVNLGLMGCDADRVHRAMDVKGKGVVSFSEFVSASFTWEERHLDILRSAFNRVAAGRTEITRSEFALMLATRDRVEEMRVAIKPIYQKMIEQRPGSKYLSFSDIVKYVTRPPSSGVSISY